MSKNIIKPLMFVTDEEKKQLMIEVEKEKSAIRLSHIATNHFDPAYIINTPRIENNYNPFIHACKSVYGFIKDNVKINVGINKNLIDANNSIIGIIPSEPKTLKNLPKNSNLQVRLQAETQ